MLTFLVTAGERHEQSTFEPQQRDFDRACYRQRNRIERLIGRLK